MDLVIKNGVVVTSGAEFKADVGIENDVIVEISTRLDGARTTIDAGGKFVMPGAIDPHTHLNMPFMGTFTADDFETGTIAAACGGVTCLVDFAIQPKGASLAETLATWKAKAQGKAVVDYSFHVAVTDATDHVIAEIPDMAKAGITSLKCFMAYKGSLMIDDAALFRVLQAARAVGALVMVHAENGDVIDVLTKQALRAGQTSPRYHAVTRPPMVEAEATARAITLAALADAPIFIVHVSCADALRHIESARDRGQPVYAETCPQYLGVVTAERYEEVDFNGAKYVCSPPIRDASHPPHIWDGLRSGALLEISSDHCPFNLKGQKEMGRHNFVLIPNGVPGIETLVPIVFTEGVQKRRVSMTRFVELVSTNTAKIFGMFPQKGTIAVGSDADIMILDPNKEVTVSQKVLHQNLDYTPYEGYRAKGWPMVTLSRGHVVYDHGEVRAKPGHGRFIARKAFQGI
ncbi:MAG: dihydropyrimidinase [Armatimonadota bacterium]